MTTTNTQLEVRMNTIEKKVDDLSGKIAKLDLAVAVVIEKLDHIVSYDDIKNIVDEKIKIHTQTCAPLIQAKTRQPLDTKSIVKIILTVGAVVGALMTGRAIPF